MQGLSRRRPSPPAGGSLAPRRREGIVHKVEGIVLAAVHDAAAGQGANLACRRRAAGRRMSCRPGAAPRPAAAQARHMHIGWQRPPTHSPLPSMPRDGCRPCCTGPLPSKAWGSPPLPSAGAWGSACPMPVPTGWGLVRGAAPSCSPMPPSGCCRGCPPGPPGAGEGPRDSSPSRSPKPPAGAGAGADAGALGGPPSDASRSRGLAGGGSALAGWPSSSMPENKSSATALPVPAGAGSATSCNEEGAAPAAGGPPSPDNRSPAALLLPLPSRSLSAAAGLLLGAAPSAPPSKSSVKRGCWLADVPLLLPPPAAGGAAAPSSTSSFWARCRTLACGLSAARRTASGCAWKCTATWPHAALLPLSTTASMAHSARRAVCQVPASCKTECGRGNKVVV